MYVTQGAEAVVRGIFFWGLPVKVKLKIKKKKSRERYFGEV